jgi:hypothetical protein
VSPAQLVGLPTRHPWGLGGSAVKKISLARRQAIESYLLGAGEHGGRRVACVCSASVGAQTTALEPMDRATFEVKCPGEPSRFSGCCAEGCYDCAVAI